MLSILYLSLIYFICLKPLKSLNVRMCLYRYSKFISIVFLLTSTGNETEL